ncbi:MAG: hypothetical protein L3J51_09755 [Cocleimonas sp.]|nr:hypothetical protein [Cocleimonas sp.]
MSTYGLQTTYPRPTLPNLRIQSNRDAAKGYAAASIYPLTPLAESLKETVESWVSM